jgi:hypothetical protein
MVLFELRKQYTVQHLGLSTPCIFGFGPDFPVNLGHYVHNTTSLRASEPTKIVISSA